MEEKKIDLIGKPNYIRTDIEILNDFRFKDKLYYNTDDGSITGFRTNNNVEKNNIKNIINEGAKKGIIPRHIKDKIENM